MAGSTLKRARGTLTILRELPRQHRVPFLPAERVRELRDARVRSLLRYAADTVPHYRELLRAERIEPHALRSAEDLARLPFVEKRQLQDDPGRFVSRSPLARDPVVLVTSGSTGTPVTVARDRRSLLAMVAYSERERAIEVRFCGRRYGYVAAQLYNPGGNVRRVQDSLSATSFRPFRPRLHPLSIADPLERTAEKIARIRPIVLHGYGTYLELLFRALAGGQVSFPLPRVVFYAGDRISSEGRRLIRDSFDVPVLSRYAAAEAIRIGFFCELGRGFHLHEDLCHLTVVDRDGRPAEPGDVGEVVVTDLLNRASVLINYRLGDLAALSEEPCPCGRSSRVLTDLQGRTSDIVRLTDETFVHPLLIEGPVRRNGPGVLRFQVVQETPDRFRLKLVTVDDAAYLHASTAVVKALQKVLHGATVEVERHAELAAGPSGKFRSVVALGSAP
jgi:phenylacetate-CoA ligase